MTGSISTSLPWFSTLAPPHPCKYFHDMTAIQIIEEFKELPPAERAKVTKFVVENDDSWIPESFKQGMVDAEAGRFVDMETVLSGAPPPARRKRK